MSGNNTLTSIISQLLKIFCAGGSKPNQQQQYGNYNQQQQQQQYGGQQQQYGQQQQQGYPGQQQAYPPPQQQPFGGYPGEQQQQQQQQPPYQQHPSYGQQGQGQSWSQVASSHQNGQHQSHHQHNQQHGGQNQYYNQHQNGGHQSKPYGLPAGGIIGPHHPHSQDENMVNQANEKYVGMRNQARHEGDESHRCFAQSQEAYQGGDGARAHELSMEGKNHAKRQDDIDEEAANWIYHANNTDSPSGTIDLHGLYVQEAIQRTETAITQGQQSGQEEIQIIVGKGIHSKGHQAKIKPAVEDLMRKYNLSAHLDPHNTGVLVVDLQGRQINGRTRDAGGLIDAIGQKDGGDCSIM